MRSPGAVAAALAPSLAAGAVGLLAATLRIETVGAEGLAPRWAAGRPLIYAVWHGRILMVPWLNAWLRRTRGARPVRVLASRSRDGELMTRFVTRFGLDAIRGSSSQGGAAALRELAGALRDGRDVGVVPDGPRGPRCRVQPGIVALARLTGAPVVPLAFAAHPARRLRTWDEFMIPLPFARGALVFGEPFCVLRDADAAAARETLEQALTTVTATADRLVAR